MLKPLIKLERVDVVLDGQTILRDIGWELRVGQHWAILGGNGSGKSTFLKLVRGDLWPAPNGGRRTYAFEGDEQTSAVGVRERIGMVSPELQERYLQQEWMLTGLQVVQTGFFNTDYLCQKPAREQKAAAASIIRLLGIEELLARNVQELSTGELRKILIARALAGGPRILILDEVCDGLDARSRINLLETVQRVADSGTQILHTTHRAEEIIPAITHVMVLKKGRMITCDNNRGAGSESNPGPIEPRRVPSPGVLVPHAPRATAATPTLIRIQRGNVFLGRKRILHNIDWELRADQHWVILGPNGAGKSTFLKLIFGDLHPAVGGTVQHFDLSANRTIWEVKQKIGYVSPHLQANYRETLTGAEVVASGFFSSIGLADELTSRQRSKVRRLLASFGLNALARKSVLRMSYGEFRTVLTLRALVNEPQVLILDEPFDGLDAEAKAAFAKALDRVSRNGTRLIIVTHHPGDLPGCITHGLLLIKGRIVCQGELEQVRHHPAAQRLFSGSA